jgi:lipoyl-dependent peroxiredoxin
MWRGDLKTGKGALSTDSSILADTPFSIKTRFKNGIATKPEERLAVAHAGCFAMLLSAQLGKADWTPENLETRATRTFEKVEEHFATTKSHLGLQALVPGAKQDSVDAAVKSAETGCPVSKLFTAKSSVDACLQVTARPAVV